jgi:hypothetical protein
MRGVPYSKALKYIHFVPLTPKNEFNGTKSWVFCAVE